MESDKRIAIIDCQMAGISGDMILGTLLDLGADSMKVVEAIESVKDSMKGCKNLEVTIRDVERKGFHAKKIDVIANEVAEMTGQELIKATMNCIENIKLSVGARQFASDSINTLVNTEARVHGIGINELHLHEAGSVDTPAEIVGTTIALDDLNFFKDVKVYSTPVAVGGGLFKFSHGTVSSPAPATLEILRSKGFPMIGGPIESELATPTGVSLLVNLAHEATHFYPPIRPTFVGYGAGSRDFAEMPNILRVTLGEPLDYQLLRDEITVLETNLDDVTGEIIGYTVDKLLQEGAKDVSIIPMFTKKNRPGHILKIIADKTNTERLSRVLMEETGTLGVRVYPCERHILNRELIQIDLLIENVKELAKVKVAKDRKGKIVQIKPEYEDVERIADKSNIPPRKVMEFIQMKAREVLQRGNCHDRSR
ncbi:MAG: nickel pincer cofactor biosynthesis protein LarC [Candidatus Heimdallarchaeota archaeon]